MTGKCGRIHITHEPAIHRKLRVFLCHSSKDKIKIRELYQKLCSEKIEPWFDEENLLPGQDWQREITKAVRESDAIIVCLSSNSTTKAGYVHKEIKVALEIAEQQPEGTIYIIPIKIDQCEVPEELRHLHFVNFSEKNGFNKLVQALQKRADDLKLKNIQFPISSCSPWSKIPGSEQASRFTPKVYPAKVKRVRFYITADGKPSTPFEIRCYDDSKENQPGELLSDEKIVAAATYGDEWVDIDISNSNIIINKGDFYISMYWITAPGENGENAQFLGASMFDKFLINRTFRKFDTTGSWVTDNGTQWMIQAIMDNDEVLDNTIEETDDIEIT